MYDLAWDAVSGNGAVHTGGHPCAQKLAKAVVGISQWDSVFVAVKADVVQCAPKLNVCLDALLGPLRFHNVCASRDELQIIMTGSG